MVLEEVATVKVSLDKEILVQRYRVAREACRPERARVLLMPV